MLIFSCLPTFLRIIFLQTHLGQGLDADALQVALGIEVGQGTVRQLVAHCNGCRRSHRSLRHSNWHNPLDLNSDSSEGRLRGSSRGAASGKDRGSGSCYSSGLGEKGSSRRRKSGSHGGLRRGNDICRGGGRGKRSPEEFHSSGESAGEPGGRFRSCQ